MSINYSELYALREKILPVHLASYVSENPHYHTITDSAEFFSKVLVDAPAYIAVDTETYYNSSVGAKNDNVITLWIKEQPNNMPFCTTVFYGGNGYFLTEDLSSIDIMFKSEQAPLMVGHNIKYDMQMFANVGADIFARAKLGVPVYNIIGDTMAMIHAVDEEHMCRMPDGTMKRSKALKNLTYHYLSADGHKYEEMVAEVRVAIANYYGISANEVDYYAVMCVAPEIMKDYACSDVEYTYELYPIILDMLKKEDTVEAYKIDMNAMIAVISMQRRGVATNKAQMLDDEAVLKDIQRVAHNNINEMLRKEINPDSHEELIARIEEVYDIKYPFFTSKGKWATSKQKLKMFVEQFPQVGELIDTVLLFRKAGKILSTYVYNTLGYIQDDGRVHAEFNLNPNDFDKGGTKTGRLSSSNPNLQNVPKKVVRLKHPTSGIEYVFNPREYYVADEGYSMVFNDYDAQEYSVLGHYSKDENYIAGLNAGLDIHRFTYATMYNKPYNEVDDDDRAKGKTLGFSIVYQVGNPSLAVALGYKINIDALTPATRFMYDKKPAFHYPPYKNPKVTLDDALFMAEAHFKNEAKRLKEEEIELLTAELSDDIKVKIGIVQKAIRDNESLYNDVIAGINYYYDPYVQEGIAYAIDMKKRYFANFPQIKEFLDEAKKRAASRLWVRTYYKRKRHIKDSRFAYAMPNAIIQGTCADVMKMKLYELWVGLQNTKSFLILSVHDEVGTMIHDSERYLIGDIKTLLEDLPFRVKITVGTEIAKDWGHKSDFIEEATDDELLEDTEEEW